VTLAHGAFRGAKRSGIEPIISRLNAGSYCAGHPPMTMRTNKVEADRGGILCLDLAALAGHVSGIFQMAGADNS
jgi:hypothetical protein